MTLKTLYEIVEHGLGGKIKIQIELYNGIFSEQILNVCLLLLFLSSAF